MIMTELDGEFVDLVGKFLESSRDVRDAAGLCDDDPIKQEMVAFVVKDFQEVWARSEALHLLVANDYSNCRDFILSEIKEITQINLSVAKSIRDKLESLSWN